MKANNEEERLEVGVETARRRRGTRKDTGGKKQPMGASVERIAK